MVLGERNLIKYEANQTNFYVTDLRIHPAFNPGTTLRNNLALLKLNLPAAGYRPACLPPTGKYNFSSKNCKMCYTVFPRK